MQKVFFQSVPFFFFNVAVPDAVQPSKAVNSVLRGTQTLSVDSNVQALADEQTRGGGEGTKSEEGLRARLCENHKTVLGGLQ